MTMTDDETGVAGIDEFGSLVDSSAFERVYPIKDLDVRAEADGRKVVRAYAAVFNKEVVVSDWEGEYREVIKAGSFARTIANRGTKVQVFYNHGKDLYGMPAAQYAMPLGTPLLVEEDGKGVITETRFSRTSLAEEVLQLIEDKAIRGMSFGGRWVAWEEREPNRAGQLRLVERTEVDMREFGPTPFPVYEQARVLGVRHATLERLAEVMRAMPLANREALATMLGSTRPDAPASTGTGSDSGPLEAQPDAARAAELDRMRFDLEHRRRQLAG